MPPLDDFHEIRFPIDIAFGASGGPARNTEVITLGSGKEHRNQRWFHSRRQFDAGYGIKSLNALYAVAEFYEARRGPLFGFRFRDPLDWKSCAPENLPNSKDQLVGVGDGKRSRFQIVKSYGSPAHAYERPIVKPVADSISVSVDGKELSISTDYNVDTATGTLIFVQAAIPGPGSEITVGFEFDVPVRFADDKLSINLSDFSAGNVPSIPLVELII